LYTEHDEYFDQSKSGFSVENSFANYSKRILNAENMLSYLDKEYYFKDRRNGRRTSDPNIKREFPVTFVLSHIFCKSMVEKINICLIMKQRNGNLN